MRKNMGNIWLFAQESLNLQSKQRFTLIVKVNDGLSSVDLLSKTKFVTN